MEIGYKNQNFLLMENMWLLSMKTIFTIKIFHQKKLHQLQLMEKKIKLSMDWLTGFMRRNSDMLICINGQEIVIL